MGGRVAFGSGLDALDGFGDEPATSLSPQVSVPVLLKTGENDNDNNYDNMYSG